MDRDAQSTTDPGRRADGAEPAPSNGRGNRQPVPAVRQVRQLSAILETVIGPELIDANDHVNVQHYLTLAVQAMNERCAMLGMGFEHTESGFTQFTAEYHLRFIGELRLGAHVTAHVRMLARSAKAFHAMAFLVDSDQARVAFIGELVAVGVDVETRRTTDFPPDTAAMIDQAIARDTMLDWPAPVTGSMGVTAL